MTARPPRPDRQLQRRLRRADALLREAERALHDLPDHHCPADRLMRIRLHNAAGTPAAQEPATMPAPTIVLGPTGSGKTLHAVDTSRHSGPTRLLADYT